MIPGISFDNDRKPLRTKTIHELGGSPNLAQAIPDQTGSMPVKVGMNPASSVQRQSVIEMRFLGGWELLYRQTYMHILIPRKKVTFHEKKFSYVGGRRGSGFGIRRAAFTSTQVLCNLFIRDFDK